MEGEQKEIQVHQSIPGQHHYSGPRIWKEVGQTPCRALGVKSSELGDELAMERDGGGRVKGDARTSGLFN